MENSYSRKFNLFFIFVIAAVTLGFELVLSIIFGLVLPANEVPLAIALALLGIASGGILSFLWSSAKPETLMRLAFFMAAAILVASSCLLQTEFVTSGAGNTFVHFSGIWKKLALLIPVLFLPFLFGGFIQAEILKKAGNHFGLFYGVDLIGAMVGSVLFPHLLPYLELKGTLLALSIATFTPVLFYLLTTKPFHRRLTLLGLSVAVLLVLLSSTLDIRYEASSIRFAYGRVKELWSPVTRVSLWRHVTGFEGYVSGSQSFTAYVPSPWELARAYPWTVVFESKSGGDGLIIAAGAGAEVTIANEFQMNSIDAVDISGALVEEMTVTRANEKGNPFNAENVTYLASDARTYLGRNDKKYDLIILRTRDSDSILTRLSSSISTSYIHTEEAIAEYLKALKPDGFFVFGTAEHGFDSAANVDRIDENNPLNWYDMTYARFISIVSGLKKFGVQDPSQHLLIFASYTVPGMPLIFCISPTPFTEDRIRALLETVEKRKSNEKLSLIYPAIDVSMYNKTLLQRDKSETVSLTLHLLSQNIPLQPFRQITDDRPYYFGSSIFKKSNIPYVDDLGLRFWLIFISIGMLLLAAVVVPMRIAQRKYQIQLPKSLSASMILTGLGFIMVEISGMARFQIFLEDPIISAIVVLATIILGAGLGSLHSSRLQGQPRQVLLYVLATVFLIGAVFSSADIFHIALMSLPFPMTVALIAISFSMVGYVMGHVVPLSIQYFAGQKENVNVYAWTITVSASTLGTIVSDALARDYGFKTVALTAMGCYALLALLVLMNEKIKNSIRPFFN